jgi:glycerol-1-phosphatase
VGHLPDRRQPRRQPRAASASLLPSRAPLAQGYDVALLDLDGVVYVGRDAVPGAAEVLREVRALGMRVAFVTNNAARTATSIAAHLVRLGIAVQPNEVVTSAQAAAHYLADRLRAGSTVLVVGGDGLVESLSERSLRPVHSANDDPVAVVQGYWPDTDWRMLSEGALAIQRGALWVATNLDATIPSARGLLPGNGALVAALRHATGHTPIATGKPDPTMHREMVERSGARHPLVVGDRLDTDIEGANRVGCDSLLVLSGVTSPFVLVRASADQHPSYLARDIGGLLMQHPQVHVEADRRSAACQGWLASWLDAETVSVQARRPAGDGGQSAENSATNSATNSAAAPSDDRAGSLPDAEDDALNALRAVCCVSWGTGAVGRFVARDDAAAAVLQELGLA